MDVILPQWVLASDNRPYAGLVPSSKGGQKPRRGRNRSSRRSKADLAEIQRGGNRVSQRLYDGEGFETRFRIGSGFLAAETHGLIHSEIDRDRLWRRSCSTSYGDGIGSGRRSWIARTSPSAAFRPTSTAATDNSESSKPGKEDDT